MNKEILERINEIDKELENLESEENDMNEFDKLINEYTTLSKEQEEIFNMYRDLVRKGATFNDIFEDAVKIFGKDGFVEIVKVIAKGYVTNLHLNNDLSLTREELEFLVMIHLGLDIDKEDEKELDNVLYALCATAIEYRNGGNR